MMMKPTNTMVAGLAKAETKEFRIIFAISFLIFFAVVMVARLLPRQWRIWLPPQTEKRMSVISETKAMVNTFIPFAYMA